MQRLKKCRNLLVSSMIAIGLMGVAGCVYERPAPPPPAPEPVAYNYYYYPDEEVYFYPNTGVYFWFGGGGWHSGRRLPNTIVLHSEARVNVRLNTRVPYERHEEIRTRYPSHRPEPRREERGEPGPR
jgi:hypothetical protein